MPKCTIINPQLDIISIKYIHDMLKSICNRTQAKKPISRHPICMTDSDYDYILEEIYRREKSILKDM